MTGGINAMQVDVNGTRLWFDVDGPVLVPDGSEMRQRPTVVLVHGGPGGYDHSYFKPDFGRLAEHAQVVYLDLRGHGRSDWGDAERVELRGLRRRRPRLLRHGRDRPADRLRTLDGRTDRPALRRAPSRDMRPGSSSSRGSRGGTRHGWSKASAASPATRSRRSRGAATPDDEVPDEEWARVFAAFGPHVPDEERDGSRAQESRAQLARNGAHPPTRHRRPAQPHRRRRRSSRSARSTPSHRSPRPKRSSTPCRTASARLEVIAGAGHFTWLDAPDRFWPMLVEFIDSTTGPHGVSDGT